MTLLQHNTNETVTKKVNKHPLWGSAGLKMPIHAHFFQQVILTRKIGHNELVLGLQSRFVQARLPVYIQSTDYSYIYLLRSVPLPICRFINCLFVSFSSYIYTMHAVQTFCVHLLLFRYLLLSCSIVLFGLTTTRLNKTTTTTTSLSVQRLLFVSHWLTSRPTHIHRQHFDQLIRIARTAETKIKTRLVSQTIKSVESTSSIKRAMSADSVSSNASRCVPTL